MAEQGSSFSPLTDSYLAGLLDGEGYLGISHVKRADTYNIRIQVAMVTKGSMILDRMQSRYGGRITARPPETERNAPKEVWVLDGQEANDALRAARPHLILKSDQADCCLDLWAAILESRELRGRIHWTDGLRRHAHHLMLRVQEGNRRGPEPMPPRLPALTPVAVYRWGEWWSPQETLFGPQPFMSKFPSSGMMISGRIYETSSPVQPTSSPGQLPPTPDAYEASRGGSQHPDKRKAGGHSPHLASAVEHLL